MTILMTTFSLVTGSESRLVKTASHEILFVDNLSHGCAGLMR